VFEKYHLFTQIESTFSTSHFSEKSWKCIFSYLVYWLPQPPGLNPSLFPTVHKGFRFKMLHYFYGQGTSCICVNLEHTSRWRREIRTFWWNFRMLISPCTLANLFFLMSDELKTRFFWFENFCAWQKWFFAVTVHIFAIFLRGHIENISLLWLKYCVLKLQNIHFWFNKSCHKTKNCDLSLSTIYKKISILRKNKKDKYKFKVLQIKRDLIPRTLTKCNYLLAK